MKKQIDLVKLAKFSNFETENSNMKKKDASTATFFDSDFYAKQLLTEAVVTVPTETVEGYAVLLNSEKAVQALMKKKSRGFDSGKVFTLVPETKVAISRYVLVSPLAKKLISKYVPGEITLILPKNPAFSHFYYDHFDAIGIRIPNHPLFPPLLKTVGPLLLTSANPRGGTPKTLTGHLPSTIVDLREDEPKIIRQGNLIVDLTLLHN